MGLALGVEQGPYPVLMVEVLRRKIQPASEGPSQGHPGSRQKAVGAWFRSLLKGS